MLENLSLKISQKMIKYDIISKADEEVYSYGIYQFIMLLLNLVTSFLLGLLFQLLIPCIILNISYILIRINAAGYHADTHFKCKATMFICSFAVIFISVIIEDIYSLWIHIFLLASYLISVIIFAPIEHKNLPMTVEKRKHNRIISIVTAVMLTIVNILGYYNFKKISLVASLTLFVIAVLLIIPAIFKRRMMKHEKNCKKNAYTQC